LIKLMTGNAGAEVEIQQTARTMMLTAEDLGGDKPMLDMYISLIYGSLGDAYQALGTDTKLHESLSESLHLLKTLHTSYPDNSEFTRYLTWAHQALGNYFLDRKNWMSPLEQHQACLAARLSLVKDPEDWISQYDLAWAYHIPGTFYFTSGQPDLPKATHYYENAYDIREKLTQCMVRPRVARGFRRSGW
jgi:tetratricopeptide (TPR) repeat protein